VELRTSLVTISLVPTKAMGRHTTPVMTNQLTSIVPMNRPILSTLGSQPLITISHMAVPKRHTHPRVTESEFPNMLTQATIDPEVSHSVRPTSQLDALLFCMMVIHSPGLIFLLIGC
jgi:hypothetical protein